MSTRFRILVVCTGNICRSAQAEQLIRARITEGYPGLESVVIVESSGTQALVGSPMPQEAAALSAHYGGNPEHHAARQLTAEQINEADFVLAMAAEHRRAVVRLLPRASRNTFTFTEFAALLENAAGTSLALQTEFAALNLADKLRSAVKWSSARRGYLSPHEASHVDVIDPYRRSNDVYEKSAHQIVEALDQAQRAVESLTKQVNA